MRPQIKSWQLRRPPPEKSWPPLRSSEYAIQIITPEVRFFSAPTAFPFQFLPYNIFRVLHHQVNQFPRLTRSEIRKILLGPSERALVVISLQTGHALPSRRSPLHVVAKPAPPVKRKCTPARWPKRTQCRRTRAYSASISSASAGERTEGHQWCTRPSGDPPREAPRTFL